jgi:putative endonuclease
MFYFYLLRCKDGTLYCGSTNDLQRRLKLHNSGRGSAYVKSRGGGEIVYSESFATLGDAMRREIEVKKWSKAKKENLVLSQPHESG